MIRRAPNRPWRWGATGLALAAVYVLVALVTPRLTGRPLRPLFDGFAPPQPYAWVNPPPEFAKDNRKPAQASQDVAIGPEGSAASNSTTADGQAIAGLDVGSAPVHFPDAAVRVKVTPVDPATLGALPAGTRPEGNAYQVALSYQPSGQALTVLAKPGTIALTAAAPATGLLYSPDGTTWQDAGGRPFGGSNGLFAQLTAPGYFLATSRNPPRASVGSGGGAAGVLVGVGLVAAVAVIGAVFTMTSKRRRRA